MCIEPAPSSVGFAHTPISTIMPFTTTVIHQSICRDYFLYSAELFTNVWQFAISRVTEYRGSEVTPRSEVGLPFPRGSVCIPPLVTPHPLPLSVCSSPRSVHNCHPSANSSTSDVLIRSWVIIGVTDVSWGGPDLGFGHSPILLGRLKQKVWKDIKIYLKICWIWSFTYSLGQIET